MTRQRHQSAGIPGAPEPHPHAELASSDAAFILPRPRLVRRLRQAVQTGDVLISAPPGYGKSTLLREYSAHHPGAQVIPFHADTVTIDDIQSRLTHAPPDAPILLDDVQYLDDHQDLLGRLAERITTGARPWIIAGRNIPNRLLTAANITLQLSAQDLALTEAEAQHLLAAGNASITEAQRQAWYRRTQGWPLALTLARHSAQPHPEAESLPEPHGVGAAQPLLAAITQPARALLDQLPGALQTFMLVSAVPLRLNQRLCSALLQRPIAEIAAQQGEILRRNLFLQADDEPGWYRYHDLIREFLNREAQRRMGDAAVNRYLRVAAEWFSANGYAYAAIDHALPAGAFDLAGPYLVALDPVQIWDRGLVRTYRRWITALDEKTQARYPALLIRLGRTLLNIGERDNARGLIERAHIYARNLEDNELVWEAETALAKLHNMEGSLQQTLEICDAILSHAPPDHPAAIQALNASGVAYTQLNRFRAARGRFGEGIRRLQQAQGNRTPAVHSNEQMLANLHHNLAVGVYIPLGRYAEAEHHLRINDEYHAQRPVARSMHLLAWCGFHESHGDWDGLSRDLSGIETAEALSEHPDEENIWYYWYKALWRIGAGAYATARTILNELGPMMVTDEDRLCLAYAEAWCARRRGDLSEAQRIARNALESSLVGPLYRGMLAFELMMAQDTENQAGSQDASSHARRRPHADPVPQDLAGLLQVRAAPWLLRLHAHFAATCHALATPESQRRARRHLAKALRYTEQKFYLRLLIDREPELGLRFWTLCLELDQASERAVAALVALANGRNGLERDTVLAGVRERLEHTAPTSRRHAAGVLRRIGDERSIPALAQRLARESDAPVREALEKALEALESAPPPLLRVRLLGEFQVQRGADLLGPADWQRPAVRRLFQYFALHAGQLLSRDRILDDLWPDSEPEAARNTFRTLFSWLRKALDPYLRPKSPARYLDVAGEIYCFAPEWVRDRVAIDADDFQATIRAGLAAEEPDDLPQLAPEFLLALDAWAPLLPDLPYEPWAVAARERIASLYVDGCLHAAQSLLHLRRDAEAAQWARRAIDTAPWLEEAYQTLMRAQARQGQRALALRTYAEAAEALARELDIAPSSLTDWLAQRLRQAEDI